MLLKSSIKADSMRRRDTSFAYKRKDNNSYLFEANLRFEKNSMRSKGSREVCEACIPSSLRIMAAHRIQKANLLLIFFLFFTF